MENITKTTHPMMLVAAASVTIASLAAAAHFTGLLPSHSNEAPSAPTSPLAAVTTQAPASVAAEQPALAKAEAPAPAPEASRPAARPRTHHRTADYTPPVRHSSDEPAHTTRRSDEDWRYQSGTQRVSTNGAGIDVIPSNSTPVPAPAVCRDCGTVESVREIAAKSSEGPGLGAVAGGVIGGILGHQVGRGSGRDLATIAGAVGGAVAGHQVEKNVRTDRQYQVNVRFDDGSLRSYTESSPNWRQGDRVRLSNGTLVASSNTDR